MVRVVREKYQREASEGSIREKYQREESIKTDLTKTPSAKVV
jgi:hypothetical protein